ncbi:MAG: ankyrin repeat domain-containing protein [Gemmatimonadota bacterium]
MKGTTMSEELQLLEAAANGEVAKARKLIDQGADVHQRDEQGWTPLAWAAGRGDAELVRTLLDHGADVSVTGRDNRTPLMIAKAAGRKEVIEILTEAEKEKGVWEDPRKTRPYCKAYYLRYLRRFSGWTEGKASANGDAGESAASGTEGDEEETLTNESIVYVHQDFTVTRSMWHGEDVLYDDVSDDWQRFCEQKLEFAIPEDLL